MLVPSVPVINDAHETSDTAVMYHVTPINVMAASNYIVHATVDSSARVRMPVRVLLDTGSAYNIIPRSDLSPNWQAHRVQDACFSNLGYSNGNPIPLQHAAQLWVRFGNTPYHMCFFVLSNLSCPVLLGTQLMNRNVEAIWFIQHTVPFTRAQVPIVTQRTKEAPRTETPATEAQP